MMGKLNIGSYELTFDFYTEMQRRKHTVIKNKIHVTLLLSDQDFYENVYLKRHGQNL
jgi:hypothetical protein